MGCIYLFPFIYTYGLLIGIRAVCFHQFHCFIDSFRPAHAKSISHSRQLCAGSTSSARGMRWRSADSRWLSLRAWRPGWRFKGFSWRRSWSSWAARSRRLDSSWTQMPTWSRPTRAMYVVSGSLQLCASFYSSCRDLRNPSARLEKKKDLYSWGRCSEDGNGLAGVLALATERINKFRRISSFLQAWIWTEKCCSWYHGSIMLWTYPVSREMGGVWLVPLYIDSLTLSSPKQ